MRTTRSDTANPWHLTRRGVIGGAIGAVTASRASGAISSAFWSRSGASYVHTGGVFSSTFSTTSEMSDTALSAGSAGVTITLGATASIYEQLQDGLIRQINLHVKTAGTGWKLKVYAQDSGFTTYTLVSESAAFTVGGTGTQTITLPSPIACGVGNVVGLFIPHGCALWAGPYTSQANSIGYKAGDAGSITAVDGSVSNLKPGVETLGDPPFLVVTGDSISAGHTLYNSINNEGGAGDVRSQIAYQIQQIIGPSFQYQNWGKGSKPMSWVNTAAMNPLVQPANPIAILIHAGINDIVLGPSSGFPTITDVIADTMAALDGIKAKMFTWQHLFLDEVLPDASVSSSDIAAMNAAIASWAASNGATLIRVHDLMGSPVGSNTINPAWTTDGLHPNIAGYAQLAAVQAKAISAQYKKLFPGP